MSISTSDTELVLSAVNSSKTAYARIKFFSGFFLSYSAPIQHAEDEQEAEETMHVQGSILVKVCIMNFWGDFLPSHGHILSLFYRSCAIVQWQRQQRHAM